MLEHTLIPKATQRNCRRLTRFNIEAQQYGMFFAGFPWQLFGCGTFQSRVGAEQATALFINFVRSLQRRLKVDRLAYIAVLENRYSGCGHPPSPYHWHFVIASPIADNIFLVSEAQKLWEERFGNSKIEAYDPKRSGAHYIAKLAGTAQFEYWCDNLDRLPYHGATDLFDAFQHDPYVPDHVRQKTFGETLRIRRPCRSHLNKSDVSTATTTKLKTPDSAQAKGAHRGRNR